METYKNIYELIKVKFPELLQEGKKITSTNSNNANTLKEELIELPHQFFCIEDSAATILNLPSFKTHPWWMCGELLTEFLALNPPIMNKYANETIEQMYKLTPQGTCEYCYGVRWGNFNQLENARKKLTDNPSSKKVIIQTWEPQDMSPERIDSPCNVNYMLLNRDNKLDLTATIRSNDAQRGLKFDYYLASFMQQSLASWTNLDVGKLYFSINSLHTYGKDLDKIEQIITEVNNVKTDPIKLVLPFNLESRLYWDNFRRIERAEQAAYNGAWDSLDYQIDKNEIPLFRDFARIFAIKNGNHYKKPHMVDRYTKEIESTEVKRWLEVPK